MTMTAKGLWEPRSLTQLGCQGRGRKRACKLCDLVDEQKSSRGSLGEESQVEGTAGKAWGRPEGSSRPGPLQQQSGDRVGGGEQRDPMPESRQSQAS